MSSTRARTTFAGRGTTRRAFSVFVRLERSFVVDGPLDADGARRQVDVLPAQRQGLAGAQARPHQQQKQQLVRVAGDRSAEALALFGRHGLHAARLDLPDFDSVARISDEPERPVAHGRAQHLGERRDRELRGPQSSGLRLSQGRHHLALDPLSVQSAQRHVAERRQNVSIKQLEVDAQRARAQRRRGLAELPARPGTRGRSAPATAPRSPCLCA